MKNTKKLLALVMAVMMVMSLATTAFAAMEGTLEDGSITITNPTVGQTYSAYQILYLESYDADAGTYAYKANSAWVEWLAEQTDYVAIDDQGYVTWFEGANVAEFAKLAQGQLEGKTADKAVEAEADQAVVLDDLKLGYYLVDTTLGTLCSLDTTNPAVEMEEKNEAPTIEKEVKEDSTGVWGETNDADTNQIVEFKATITVQKGAENYIMHDTMSAGLTYVADSVKVMIGENVVDATEYTVTAPGTCNCTFEVAFDNEYIASLDAGTKIDVYYSAVLNEDAVVGLPGNPNEVKLQYGDSTNPSFTPDDTTITYTWDMKIIKYTKDAEDKEVLLADATFKICTDAEGNNALKFHALGDNKYELCTDAACEAKHVTEITTDATGTFHIEGLDADTYYLVETKAPAGYNMLAGPITIEVKGLGDNPETEEVETDYYTTLETKVLNQSGTELPSTGGIGTTMFYVFGSVMVLAAVVLLVTKRRMSITE